MPISFSKKMKKDFVTLVRYHFKGIFVIKWIEIRGKGRFILPF
jgi:hypothetical protein